MIADSSVPSPSTQASTAASTDAQLDGVSTGTMIGVIVGFACGFVIILVLFIHGQQKERKRELQVANAVGETNNFAPFGYVVVVIDGRVICRGGGVTISWHFASCVCLASLS